jgi:hypothetical protein
MMLISDCSISVQRFSALYLASNTVANFSSAAVSKASRVKYEVTSKAMAMASVVVNSIINNNRA